MFCFWNEHLSETETFDAHVTIFSFDMATNETKVPVNDLTNSDELRQLVSSLVDEKLKKLQEENKGT